MIRSENKCALRLDSMKCQRAENVCIQFPLAIEINRRHFKFLFIGINREHSTFAIHTTDRRLVPTFSQKGYFDASGGGVCLLR